GADSSTWSERRGATSASKSCIRQFSVLSNIAAGLPCLSARSGQDVSALLHLTANLLFDPQTFDAHQARGNAQFFRQSSRPCFCSVRVGVGADDAALLVG